MGIKLVEDKRYYKFADLELGELFVLNCSQNVLRKKSTNKTSIMINHVGGLYIDDNHKDTDLCIKVKVLSCNIELVPIQ